MFESFSFIKVAAGFKNEKPNTFLSQDRIYIFRVAGIHIFNIIPQRDIGDILGFISSRFFSFYLQRLIGLLGASARWVF